MDISIVYKSESFRRQPPGPGGCCYIEYPPGLHPNLKSPEISFTHNLLLVVKSFKNFVQSTAISPPYSVQILEMIWQLKRDVLGNSVRCEFKMAFVTDSLYCPPGCF